MNGMNEAITLLPFGSRISIGIFSRTVAIDSDVEIFFLFPFTSSMG